MEQKDKGAKGEEEEKGETPVSQKIQATEIQRQRPNPQRKRQTGTGRHRDPRYVGQVEVERRAKTPVTHLQTLIRPSTVSPNEKTGHRLHTHHLLLSYGPFWERRRLPNSPG